ncbi:unnamed protein product [Rangifer tarandus platyrhynchus]|uniref:Uncharacterized protein n=2 Tax=Rangifer tarandus platyrhynchus TaxID=3082113 RepID=A0ABN8ZK49_RANTA|nr:unnamed protein product [Rangifer tarandus platyrhynchus]CAI9708365.1 unnamed protein product [Rangifer tarandus platyrhynchus]
MSTPSSSLLKWAGAAFTLHIITVAGVTPGSRRRLSEGLVPRGGSSQGLITPFLCVNVQLCHDGPRALGHPHPQKCVWREEPPPPPAPLLTERRAGSDGGSEGDGSDASDAGLTAGSLQASVDLWSSCPAREAAGSTRHPVCSGLGTRSADAVQEGGPGEAQ